MATTKIAPTDIKAGTLPSSVVTSTAPTGDSDSSIASTAFVQQELIANTVYFSGDFTGSGTSIDPIRNAITYFSNKFSGTGAIGNPIDITYPISSITTSGTSGAASLSGGVLNIPNYSATSISWGNITGSIGSQTDLSSALALKAALASPTFTGTPSAPTASLGTNTTQIATTAFVLANVGASSQTPWTSNINGGQYTLTNVKDLEVKKVVPSTGENFVLHSGAIDNATDWTIGGATVIADDALDLDGNLTLDRFTNPTTSQESLTQLVSNIVPGTTYYASWDIKNISQTSAQYEFYDFSNFATISGTVDYYSSISGTTARVEFSFVAPAGCTTVRFRPYINNFTTGAVNIGRIMICRTSGATYQVTTTSQITGSAGSTTYAISTDTTNGRVGINKATPAEALDITGNLRFSGALMPNNTSGTTGQVLKSAGAGAPPTWGSFTMPLSSITAATGSNSIDNLNNSQNWTWGTLGSSTVGMQMSSSSSSLGGTTKLLGISLGSAGIASSSGSTLYPLYVTGSSQNDNGTVYGIYASATNSSFVTPTSIGAEFLANGGGGTNIGLKVSTSGAAANYAIIVPSGGGKIGFGNSTPNSGLDLTGSSLALNYVAKTGTYTVSANDYTINCTSGTFTVTLPTSVGITGRIYIIKNSGAGVITVATNSSQTIDGNTTYSLATQYKYVEVQSDGANWIIVGNN